MLINMYIKRLIGVYLNSPWIAAITAIILLLVGTFIACMDTSPISKFWEQVLVYTFVVSFLCIIISSVVCFAKKRWVQGLIGVVALLITIVALVIASFFALFFSPSEDSFADKLTIPKNLSITTPLNGHNGKPAISRPLKPSFRLWNGIQPGIYVSEIWINPGEPGKVYLKAYEVTHRTILSETDLKDATNEHIGCSLNPKQLFMSSKNFTIYEGDWGKPYAACFEVWFSPDSGKSDRMLMQKVFKIEGWMR